MFGIGLLSAGTVGVVYYVVKRKGQVKVTPNYTVIQDDIQQVQDIVEDVDQKQADNVDKGTTAIIQISRGELDQATQSIYIMVINSYDSRIGLCNAEIKLLYTEVHAAEQALVSARRNKVIVHTRSHGNRIMVDEKAVAAAELNLGNTKIKVEKAVKVQQDKIQQIQNEKDAFVQWFKANKPELEQRYTEYRIKGFPIESAQKRVQTGLPTKF